MNIQATAVFDPPNTETGIASENMYRMSRGFIDTLYTLGLSKDGHRLLHAVLHATCRSLPTWWADEVLQTETGFRRRCILLKRTLGLEAGRSNRNLRVGVQDLQKTGLFDFIEIEEKSAALVWHFSDDALGLLFEQHEGYGLLDASLLPALRSPMDFLIYSEVARVRRMRRAQFHLFVPHMQSINGKPANTWSNVRGPLLKVLEKICAHHELSMFLLLDCEGYMRGIDNVTVRIRRDGSTWSVKDLGKVNPATLRFLIVDASGHEEVSVVGAQKRIREVRDVGWKRMKVQGL